MAYAGVRVSQLLALFRQIADRRVRVRPSEAKIEWLRSGSRWPGSGMWAARETAHPRRGYPEDVMTRAQLLLRRRSGA